MARTKKPVSRSVGKQVEKKMIGKEPVWNDRANLRIETINALNYYNRRDTVKDARKWVVEYLKNNKVSKSKIALFNSLSDQDIPMTLCSLCRLVNREMPLLDSSVEWIKNRLSACYEAAKVKKEKRQEDSQEAVRRTPTEIVKENTRDLIGEIEVILDHWEEHEDFVLYDLLKSREAPYNTAKAVADYYGELKAEIELLISKKDKELVEGYSGLGVRKRKRYLNFISSLVSDAEKFMTGKKSVRKPRAKKVPKIENQIKKLNFKKECDALKIVSVDPIKIVGASEFYVYNTRYNTVGYFLAANERGLGVKGTTIQNFDEEKSFKKRVRNPEEFLSQLATAPKVRARKLLSAEKRKPAEISGRITNDILLIKDVK